MSVIALVAVYNLENLMTNLEFRIIAIASTITNFGNLTAKGGGYERSISGAYKTTLGKT